MPPVGRTSDPARPTATAKPVPRKEVVDICRLRVPLPDSTWIGRFSRSHPELRIDVLSRLDVGKSRSLTEVRLRAGDLGGSVEEMRRLPQVEEVEQLESGPDFVHLRVVHRTSPFVPIFRELRLMRRFPFSIESGEASWVVVAPAPKARALLDRVREQVPGAAIEAVRHSDPPTHVGPLTPRQADLLRSAVAAGYFEVPRLITLTDLAKRLELAPSSLSEALAIVEKKLLERWPTAD